jgi:hypothetical protein
MALTRLNNRSISAVTELPSSITSGMVLQTVQARKTDTWSTDSKSFAVITGLSATITPVSTTSKILVLIDVMAVANYYTSSIALFRNGTEIAQADSAGSRPRSILEISIPPSWNSDGGVLRHAANYLDSPSTTSAITYDLRGVERRDGFEGLLFVNRSEQDRNTTGYDQRGASTLTLLEIAG